MLLAGFLLEMVSNILKTLVSVPLADVAKKRRDRQQALEAVSLFYFSPEANFSVENV